MKKIFVLIILGCFAQSLSAQANLGFRIGLNAGRFNAENKELGKYDITPRYNVIFGLDVDLPFSRAFSFRTGLNLAQKSAEINRTLEMNQPDTSWSTIYRMTYLEVPFLLVGHLKTDIGTFCVGAGPTISLGMGGATNIIAQHKTNLQQREYDQKIVWNGKTGSTVEENFYHFKRFDFGLGAMLSYQLPQSGLTLTFTYNKGLSDIAPSEETNFKTSYVGLSIGFMMQN